MDEEATEPLTSQTSLRSSVRPEQQLSPWAVSRLLLRNRDYTLLFAAFGVAVGNFYLLSTLLGQMMEDMGCGSMLPPPSGALC